MSRDSLDGFLDARRWPRALQRNTLDEFMIVDVKDQNAGAAIVQIVAAAEARQRRIEEPLCLLCLRTGHCGNGSQKSDRGSAERHVRHLNPQRPGG